MTGSTAGRIDESMPGTTDAPLFATRGIRITTSSLVTAGSFILLVPNLLFAWHLRLLPATLMLTGAVGFALLQYRPQPLSGSCLSQPIQMRRLAVCLVLAIVLLVLGGEGHVMFANWDWLWRDAVLADLVKSPFPPTYLFAGDTFFLRAPLGMYMVPALVAKATSLEGGHVALLLQNVTLLTLVLYLLATLAGRRAAPVVAVFVSFSGLDVLGQILMWRVAGHSLASFMLPSHIETWMRLQYSSVITQLFWVPNHALPSYWLALVALLCANRELALGELVLAMAAALFWSPFAFIGTLPLAAYLFLRDARTTVRSRRFWLSTLIALSFLPVALYMKLDVAQVPHGFALFDWKAISEIVLFLVVEIPQVAFIAAMRVEIEPWLKGVLAVAIAALIVLPTVRIGLANDLVMRASIPSLTILAFGFAQALVLAWRKRRGLLVAGICVVAVGAVTPAQEIIRSETFPAFAISDCGLVTVWDKIGENQPSLVNYLARASRLPGWLMASPLTPASSNHAGSLCWPDLPYVPYERFTTMSSATILRARRAQDQPRF